jgi:hypothetical protein
VPLTQVDQNRIDELLAFALATAAREDPDNYGRRELGPIHLIKYVYLADLAYAATHNGQTYTGAPWRFHHFGPWSEEVWGRIEPVVQTLGASQRTFRSSKAKDDTVRYELSQGHESLFERLERQLPWEVTSAIKRGVHEHGSDTTALLREVYLTKPMLRAVPGGSLEFEGEPPHMSTVREEAEEPRLTVRQRRDRKAALEALRARIRAHKDERASRRRLPADPPPPYDEIFVQGVAWLDSVAGDSPREMEAEGAFSEDVWTSGARGGSEVP